MHDLKVLREDPAAFDAGLARRGIAPLADELLALDVKRRELMTEAQSVQAARNEASKRIGAAKASGDAAAAEAVIAEVAALKDRLATLEVEEKALGEALDAKLAAIPNIPLTSVPDGTDESGNKLVRVVGEPKTHAFAAREHFDLGEGLGLMDFEGAAKLSGARFVVLKGALARLERALGQFMLDLQTGEHGYTEMQTPVLVRDNALFGTSQLPKFGDDLFRTTGDHWLIPTAEVSLTNLVADSILDAADLPIRMTALTPCFRSEAGSAGRDTRGMIRQHQFNKVELVSIATPEQALAEQERMLGCAEEVLKRLGLAYRVMELCAGDMGFAAVRTFDIEVWLPGQGQYREISSCSTCGDFQARRMKARFREQGDKQTRFVHTLNGSGLAVGRTLVAVLETYQNEDGSITVPEVLKPYMGGLDVIRKG